MVQLVIDDEKAFNKNCRVFEKTVID